MGLQLARRGSLFHRLRAAFARVCEQYCCSRRANNHCVGWRPASVSVPFTFSPDSQRFIPYPSRLSSADPTNPLAPLRFAIGYIYSFISAGVFYYLFNRLSPHLESKMDVAETGEEIIAANDAKNVAERRASHSEHKRSVVKRIFEV